MDLMQDVATSHTAHTTLSLLQADRVNVPNRLTLIQLSIIWDVLGRVVTKRCLANVENLHVQ